jgi:hypothetical protein
MPQDSKKHTNRITLFLHLVKNTYVPNPISKKYVVAIILGGTIGGFVGGTVAAGYNAMTWVVVLSICVGVVIGAGFAVSIVPKK